MSNELLFEFIKALGTIFRATPESQTDAMIGGSGVLVGLATTLLVERTKAIRARIKARNKAILVTHEVFQKLADFKQNKLHDFYMQFEAERQRFLDTPPEDLGTFPFFPKDNLEFPKIDLPALNTALYSGTNLPSKANIAAMETLYTLQNLRDMISQRSQIVEEIRAFRHSNSEKNLEIQTNLYYAHTYLSAQEDMDHTKNHLNLLTQIKYVSDYAVMRTDSLTNELITSTQSERNRLWILKPKIAVRT